MNCRSLFALSCFLMLSACLGMGGQTPAPVSKYGQASGAGSAGVHNVVAGDTLYTVAQNYNLPMRDIVHINNLRAPFKLGAGQRLKLPPPQEYQVQNGDTVYSVSLLFGVNASEISRLNNLRAPYSLRHGQLLRLPTATRKTQTYKRPASAPVVVVESEVLAPPPQMGVVEVRPAAVPVERGVQAPSKSNAWAFDPPPQKTQSLGQLQAQNDLNVAVKPMKQGADIVQDAKPIAQVQPQQVSIQNQKPLRLVNNVPKRESSKFLRPVRGDVVTDFGVKKDGTYNDGINIKAAKGTPVLAAENGVVVYAGNELKGSGNLILLRHEEQWITAYAHMSGLDVKKGDIVRRGQAIGSVGSSGSVSSPQLHFEIRRGTDALNPKNYME